MLTLIAAELTVYDASISGTRTLYFATFGYASTPTETPANTFYDGRIQQAGNITRHCFSDARTTGRSQIGYGDIVLANNDGALDGLLAYSFAGRPITIKMGTIPDGATAVPSWTTIFKGTMEQAEFSWQKVTVRVRDRLQDLAKPIQQVRYGGTNSLPNGLDGVDGDLKGKPKPLIYGKVFNVVPPQVNTDRRIYQLHDGSALGSVDAVYDRGAQLTAGTAYTSQADMEANAPSAGQYRVWNSAAGCYFRLGSAPTGTVTADATGAGTISVGQLYNAILTKAGISSGEISAADITALDAAVSYEVGIYAGPLRDVTPLELLDQLCESVGAWYGSDANGVFRIGRIEVPTGTSVGTLTTVEILKIERVAPRDPGVGIPAWKVKLAYQRVWMVQTDLNTGVADARKSFLANEYRVQEVSDTAVKTANLLSPELEFKTLLWNKANALTEANRRLTIYKTQRDMYEVTVRVDAALAALLDIGKIITLQVNRFGMSAGKKFLIIGVRSNMRLYHFDLTLWG